MSEPTDRKRPPRPRPREGVGAVSEHGPTRELPAHLETVDLPAEVEPTYSDFLIKLRAELGIMEGEIFVSPEFRQLFPLERLDLLRDWIFLLEAERKKARAALRREWKKLRPANDERAL